MTKNAAKKRIEKLKREINHHRYLYHVLDKIEISDAALDSLKNELVKLEEKYPELMTPDSPTQRVGGKPLAKFKKIRHSKPVLSLQDVFNEEDLKAWEERILKILPEKKPLDYFAELKIDGLSIVLRYENGLLATGATRGDGVMGEDVTQNLKTIEGIPLRLEGTKKAPAILEVRGEVYMTIGAFKKVNAARKKSGLPLYANPRNIAAGSIRQLDPKITEKRKLSFFAFEIITDLGQKTHLEVHDLLQKFGFPVNKNNRFCADSAAVFRYLKSWETKRKNLPFETDGVVVVVNDIKKQRILGSVGKAERFMIAYKFPAEQSTTVVEKIEVQVGRTGALTPVAFLRPTRIAGSTVSRASLHNEDEINKLGVRIGDTVVIQKAGDIIPEVVRVIKGLRDGNEKKFHFPKTCPICGSKVERKKNEAAHYCTNRQCFAKARRQIIHFVSKRAFNVEGLGAAIVDQMIGHDLISDAADIFKLTEADLFSLDFFAEKKAKKIREAILNSREIELGRFLLALGIRHVGEETAYDLAEHFKTLEKIKKTDFEELEEIENLGPVMAKSIAKYFEDPKNLKFLAKLEEYGVKIKPAVSSVKEDNFFKDKSFLLTGNLGDLKREKAKELIRQKGGKILSSVSRNLDYLVVGENPGSKLNDAKKLKIKILNTVEFLKLLKRG